MPQIRRRELHVPPGAFFGDILRAIARHIFRALHGLYASTAVTVEPFAPDPFSLNRFAVRPKRMSMKTVATGILLESVEVADFRKNLFHEFFKASLGTR
jgi:hypothetical protein